MQATYASQLLERLNFLLDPEFVTPEEPTCRRCKTQLKQNLFYNGEDVEIMWVCPRCRHVVLETDGSI
jgi:hypothetical protein